MSASNTSRGGGVDIPTLLITAVASAAAAYACSKIWAPGTLGAAATTPVLVALLKEMLAKPADVVTRAVPVRGVVRSAPPAGQPYDPVVPFSAEDERVAQHGEIPGSSSAFRRHAWKTAVVTGLLGFLVAAVIITVPELVAGKAASGDRQTTLLGGQKGSSAPATTTTTTTPTETETVPPADTVTVPPAQTTTVPPAQTTTTPPAQTTPVPPVQPAPAPVPPGETVPEELIP